MIGNNYSYALIDGSFLLTRNLYVVTKDKEIDEMNPGDVVKLTLQTLNRLSRDWNIHCDKLCLIFDEWDKGIGGYYRTFMVKDYVKYKGSRKWMTEQLLEEMKRNPDITEEEIKAAEKELAINKVKFISKQIMKDELYKIGIPYFSYPGWEYDDIATLASFQLFGKTESMNVIVTKDSDLSYSLCPSCCQFFLPVRGSEPRIVTYDEMYLTIPQELRDRGISLYQYFMFLNSFGISHNDTARTLAPRKDSTQAILNILNDDYSDLVNIDAFKAQMNSFNLSLFPGYADVQNLIATRLNTEGYIGSVKEFNDLCVKCNITGLSNSFYTELVGRFDQKLFSSRI